MGHDVGDSAHARARTHPLMIQGLRTNPVDQDSHVLFFDIEALIGERHASLENILSLVVPCLSLETSLLSGARVLAGSPHVVVLFGLPQI